MVQVEGVELREGADGGGERRELVVGEIERRQRRELAYACGHAPKLTSAQVETQHRHAPRLSVLTQRYQQLRLKQTTLQRAQL